jgi:hypothetical protein
LALQFISHLQNESKPSIPDSIKKSSGNIDWEEFVDEFLEELKAKQKERSILIDDDAIEKDMHDADVSHNDEDERSWAESESISDRSSGYSEMTGNRIGSLEYVFESEEENAIHSSEQIKLEDDQDKEKGSREKEYEYTFLSDEEVRIEKQWKMGRGGSQTKGKKKVSIRGIGEEIEEPKGNHLKKLLVKKEERVLRKSLKEKSEEEGERLSDKDNEGRRCDNIYPSAESEGNVHEKDILNGEKREENRNEENITENEDKPEKKNLFESSTTKETSKENEKSAIREKVLQLDTDEALQAIEGLLKTALKRRRPAVEGGGKQDGNWSRF